MKIIFCILLSRIRISFSSAFEVTRIPLAETYGDRYAGSWCSEQEYCLCGAGTTFFSLASGEILCQKPPLTLENAGCPLYSTSLYEIVAGTQQEQVFPIHNRYIPCIPGSEKFFVYQWSVDSSTGKGFWPLAPSAIQKSIVMETLSATDYKIRVISTTHPIWEGQLLKFDGTCAGSAACFFAKVNGTKKWDVPVPLGTGTTIAPSTTPPKSKVGLIVGCTVAAGLVVLLLAATIAYYWLRKRNARSSFMTGSKHVNKQYWTNSCEQRPAPRFADREQGGIYPYATRRIFAVESTQRPAAPIPPATPSNCQEDHVYITTLEIAHGVRADNISTYMSVQ